MFEGLDFLAELTQHIPPKRIQLIRRYGLYSSRTKSCWNRMPHVAARAPEAWRASHRSPAPETNRGFEPLDDGEEVTVDERKRAWARMLAKVYEIDPLVCPKCGSVMKIIAVVQDPVEIRDILAHLVKTGRAPPTRMGRAYPNPPRSSTTAASAEPAPCRGRRLGSLFPPDPLLSWR